MKKMISLLMMMTILSMLLMGCGGNTTESSPTQSEEPSQTEPASEESQNPEEPKTQETQLPIEVVDSYGRTVIFEQVPERAVCIGPGALRTYAYIMGSDKISGVEGIETKKNFRPYNLAYPAFMNMEIIGQGGPKNTPDAELLSVNKPDVIFSTYAGSPEELDELSKETGVKVIGLNLGRNVTFEDTFYDSLRIIGKTMNNQERAEDLIAYMEELKTELMGNTALDSKATKTYFGCIGYRGSQGLLSTKADFNILNNISAINVVDEIAEKPGNIMLDKEKLLELDPEVIFIDMDGEQVLKEDYKKDPTYYQTLSAFKNKQVYAVLPHNHYQTNVETAIADMFFMAKVIHPHYMDYTTAEKSNEIFKKFLHADLYATLSHEFPKAFTVYEIEEE